MFRDRLNTSLAHKLVEVGEMNEGMTLEEWYNKTVELEEQQKAFLKNRLTNYQDQYQE